MHQHSHHVLASENLANQWIDHIKIVMELIKEDEKARALARKEAAASKRSREERPRSYDGRVASSMLSKALEQRKSKREDGGIALSSHRRNLSSRTVEALTKLGSGLNKNFDNAMSEAIKACGTGEKTAKSMVATLLELKELHRKSIIALGAGGQGGSEINSEKGEKALTSATKTGGMLGHGYTIEAPYKSSGHMRKVSELVRSVYIDKELESGVKHFLTQFSGEDLTDAKSKDGSSNIETGRTSSGSLGGRDPLATRQRSSSSVGISDSKGEHDEHNKMNHRRMVRGSFLSNSLAHAFPFFTPTTHSTCTKSRPNAAAHTK